jgi:hypothetical protein
MNKTRFSPEPKKVHFKNLAVKYRNIMPPRDWEQIHYHELPDWMKKVSKQGHKKGTKIFPGKPYDYKIQYTVNRDVVSVSYWRTGHTAKPVKFLKPGTLRIVFIIFCLVAGVSFVYFYLFLPSDYLSLYTGSPQVNTSEPPGNYSLPVRPEDITHAPAAVPGAGYLQSPRTWSYSYFLDNNRNFISFTTYGGLSDYFFTERHTSYTGEGNDVIFNLLENDYQDEYLQPLIETIRKRSPDPDDQAKIAISLVQHMPYSANKPYRSPISWNYPYETLYSNEGASTDKSVLTAYLLKKMGYGTVLFEYSSHMAVGVKCSSGNDFDNSGYAFIETTRPTIITYSPEKSYGVSLSENPRIIYINDGKRVLDVSTEYRDAQRLKQLEKMRGFLNQSQSVEWEQISTTYDLQYTP